MSVDTYLKGKNLKSYRAVDHDGLRILVSESLGRWAKSAAIGVSRFLFWSSFDVEVVPRQAHVHGDA